MKTEISRLTVNEEKWWLETDDTDLPDLPRTTTTATCADCGKDYDKARWALGYYTCPPCGDETARRQRASWCVAQEYGKGNYMLITNPETLKQTNPKRTT
jgi:predicted RNA-binding Zn-ribbon protein involved in translation (DUF1610 family)